MEDKNKNDQRKDIHTSHGKASEGACKSTSENHKRA